MTTTQWIFIVFYAIFWGNIASVQGRWKMFHWPLFGFPKIRNRLILSNFLLNIFPILYFGAIFYLLKNTPSEDLKDWSFQMTIGQVIAGVSPSFAIFGFYRLWISIIEFYPNTFYYTETNIPTAINDKIEPLQENLLFKGKDSFFNWNFIFAILYLVLATLLSLLFR